MQISSEDQFDLVSYRINRGFSKVLLKPTLLPLEREMLSFLSNLCSFYPSFITFHLLQCPPCKGFTPRLVDFYNKVNEAGKNFEIVFSSGDRNEASFKEYFATMPWLALPFQDQRAKQLSAIFEVSGES